MAKKRITELATETTLKDGQYVAIDHTTDGTKKLNLGAELTDLKEDLEQTTEALQTKAEIDGAYDNMTVGNAEQLVSTVFVEDSTPYKFRTTGGSVDVGDRKYVDAIVGGTVAWNQLVPELNDSNWAGENGVTVTYSNGVATVSSTVAGNGIFTRSNMASHSGHKYLAHVVAKGTPNMTVAFSVSSTGIVKNYVLSSNAWENLTSVLSNNTETQTRLYVFVRNTTYENVQFKDAILVDLTQLFGSTIADYIYSLEQANAGAGVAWFKKLFPKDYYEYNAGELISISGLQSHDMVGFNQWDEVTESGYINVTTGADTSDNSYVRSKNYCRILPSTTYYGKAGDNPSSFVLCFYDGNKNYIGYLATASVKNTTFTTPANAQYFRLYVTAEKANDICINLSWDGERDGEYEPYIKHSYPLDSDLTLRGIPKLDSANQLYYDGDRYLPSGEVERRYGIVDLGTLTWYYTGASGHARFTCYPSNIVNYPSSQVSNIVCSLYKTAKYDDVYNDVTDKIIGATSNTVGVYDSSYSDATAFKEAMSGVMLVYELATPTTETAESYNRTQICDDFGTEEFISDSIVPVGHETKYANNLRAKLEMAPNSPDGDGDYIVRQTNGENTYVLLEKELPTAPNADGSYVLKCTVSGGTPTYTWESES